MTENASWNAMRPLEAGYQRLETYCTMLRTTERRSDKGLIPATVPRLLCIVRRSYMSRTLEVAYAHFASAYLTAVRRAVQTAKTLVLCPVVD